MGKSPVAISAPATVEAPAGMPPANNGIPQGNGEPPATNWIPQGNVAPPANAAPVQAEKKAFSPSSVLHGEHVVPQAESAATGSYVIQVVALADKAEADAMQKSLVAAGHSAFVKVAKVDGKAVYRVQLGPYPTKADAFAVHAKMKARYPSNTRIQQSFVTTK